MMDSPAPLYVIVTGTHGEGERVVAASLLLEWSRRAMRAAYERERTDYARVYAFVSSTSYDRAPVAYEVGNTANAPSALDRLAERFR